MTKVWSAVLLLGSVVLTAAGCVLAPVPIPGPVVVAPRPAYGVYHRHYPRYYHHRYGYHDW